MPPKTHTDILYGIQFLRFIAASMVVVRHSADRTFIAFGSPGFQNWSVGSTGVDIFFVISGFLMVRVTDGKNTEPLKFWLRRAVRIIPLYWLCTVFVFIATSLFPVYFFATPSFQDLMMSLLFVPDKLVNGRIAPIIPPGWTLNMEMSFYLLLALSLNFRKSYMAVACSSLFGLFIIANATKGMGYFPTFFANSVWLEFALGILLAYAIKPGDAPKPLLGIILIVIGFGLLALSQATGGERLFVWGFPAFMIVAGAVMAEPIFRKSYLSFFVLIGDASFALYLVHTIWMTPMMFYARRNPDSMLGQMNPIAFFLLLIIVSMALGLATHLAIERPLISRVRSMLWGNPTDIARGKVIERARSAPV